jgi:hypothetical protein
VVMMVVMIMVMIVMMVMMIMGMVTSSSCNSNHRIGPYEDRPW